MSKCPDTAPHKDVGTPAQPTVRPPSPALPSGGLGLLVAEPGQAWSPQPASCSRPQRPGQRQWEFLSTDGHRDRALDADQRRLPGHRVLSGDRGPMASNPRAGGVE